MRWRRLGRWAAGVSLIVVVVACAAQPLTSGQNPGGEATPLPPLPTLDLAQVERGRAIYQANCASCHGVSAEGAPNWTTPGPDGLPLAPPHDDTGHTWHHSDRVLYEAIRDGMGDPLRPDSPLRMPAWGEKLSDAEIRAVIEYFKSLWNEDNRRWQWEQTLNDFAPTPTPSP